MNIVKKEWVYQHYDLPWAKQELHEYDFDGRVDFALGPIFYYDPINHIVVDYEDTGSENAIKVLIDGELVELNKNTEISSFKVERIRLSRAYGLQEFFNEHRKAKCIIFYVFGNSVFHEGYTIRVYIDEEGYTPQEQTN